MKKYIFICIYLISVTSCGKYKASTATSTVDEYNVTTLVGGDTPGNNDGNSSVAQLDGPSGVTVASDGTVWMTDANNNSIRSIDPTARTITTNSNTNGSAGFINGDAATARFDNPDGIAVDSNGNVYVADSGNNAIRKIDGSTGIASTVAGDGSSGSNNGAIASATFDAPSGITVDNDDDNLLYVADENNHVIRKIDLTAGQVTTIIGANGTPGDNDAQGTDARLNNPHAITIGADGNLYVTDKGNNKVKKFHKTTRNVVTVAGNGVAGDNQQFNSPHGIAVDNSANIFVADEGNNKVKKISVGSIVSTIAGSGIAGFSDAVGTLAKLNSPTGLAINSSGTLYLCDYANNRIRKISK